MKKGQQKSRREPEIVGGGKGEIVIYQPTEGITRLECVWRTTPFGSNLNQIAHLIGAINPLFLGTRNVFKEGELDRDSVVAFFATTAADGKTYKVDYFNLDAVISVGYRVNSKRGTQSRIWSTSVLRDHLVQGYSVNAKRLRELQQSLKLRGREQTHRRGSVPLVHGQERHSVPRRGLPAHRR